MRTSFPISVQIIFSFVSIVNSIMHYQSSLHKMHSDTRLAAAESDRSKREVTTLAQNPSTDMNLALRRDKRMNRFRPFLPRSYRRQMFFDDYEYSPRAPVYQDWGYSDFRNDQGYYDAPNPDDKVIAPLKAAVDGLGQTDEMAFFSNLDNTATNFFSAFQQLALLLAFIQPTIGIIPQHTEVLGKFAAQLDRLQQVLANSKSVFTGKTLENHNRIWSNLVDELKLLASYTKSQTKALDEEIKNVCKAPGIMGDVNWIRDLYNDPLDAKNIPQVCGISKIKLFVQNIVATLYEAAYMETACLGVLKPVSMAENQVAMNAHVANRLKESKSITDKLKMSPAFLLSQDLYIANCAKADIEQFGESNRHLVNTEFVENLFQLLSKIYPRSWIVIAFNNYADYDKAHPVMGSLGPEFFYTSYDNRLLVHSPSKPFGWQKYEKKVTVCLVARFVKFWLPVCSLMKCDCSKALGHLKACVEQENVPKNALQLCFELRPAHRQKISFTPSTELIHMTVKWDKFELVLV